MDVNNFKQLSINHFFNTKKRKIDEIESYNIFNNLPNEVFFEILKQLDEHSIINLESSCKNLRDRIEFICWGQLNLRCEFSMYNTNYYEIWKKSKTPVKIRFSNVTWSDCTNTIFPNRNHYLSNLRLSSYIDNAPVLEIEKMDKINTEQLTDCYKRWAMSYSPALCDFIKNDIFSQFFGIQRTESMGTEKLCELAIINKAAAGDLLLFGLSQLRSLQKFPLSNKEREEKLVNLYIDYLIKAADKGALGAAALAIRLCGYKFYPFSLCRLASHCAQKGDVSGLLLCAKECRNTIWTFDKESTTIYNEKKNCQNITQNFFQCAKKAFEELDFEKATIFSLAAAAGSFDKFGGTNKMKYDTISLFLRMNAVFEKEGKHFYFIDADITKGILCWLDDLLDELPYNSNLMLVEEVYKEIGYNKMNVYLCEHLVANRDEIEEDKLCELANILLDAVGKGYRFDWELGEKLSKFEKSRAIWDEINRKLVSR